MPQYMLVATEIPNLESCAKDFRDITGVKVRAEVIQFPDEDNILEHLLKQAKENRERT